MTAQSATGGGPPANRWANRASAQRITLGPNTTEKPRYAGALASGARAS
jgi:hypothetical protein